MKNKLLDCGENYMANIALIETKPTRNDYVRLFENKFEFDRFSLTSDSTLS